MPKVAVDIVARDRTESGRKAAERSLGGFAKRTDSIAREGGLDRIGKQIEGLQRFRTLSFGFDSIGRNLQSVGGISRDTSGAVAEMTRNVLTFGGAAPKAFRAAASGAAVATGAVAGLAAAVVGLGVGTYLLGDRWAKLGADVGRSAKDFGISAQALQARRAAGERFGVTPDETDSAIEGLGSTLYDAKYGANNLALGALNQLGLKIREDGDGNIDVDGMLGDIADAVAKQKNPMVQRKLAAIFGVSSMLPALRQGSGALAAEGSDYMASGAALTDAQVAQAEEARRKSVRLRQQLSTIEKAAGVRAMGMVGPTADAGVDLMRSGETKAAREGAAALVEGGKEAARELVQGAASAGGMMNPFRGVQHMLQQFGPREDAGFDGFKRRIQKQESGGRQFRRPGVPLVSSAGAVGIMQVLPATGKAAARRAGIPWDEHRFYNDAAYNEQIGTSELFRLYQKYDGNQVLAAAAYNAGEGRLDGPYKDRRGRMQTGWLDRFGDPRKGEISNEAFAAKIPFDETRDYVAKTADMAPQKVEVDITLRGAPAGTVATVRGAPDVNVAMNVARGLEGP